DSRASPIPIRAAEARSRSARKHPTVRHETRCRPVVNWARYIMSVGKYTLKSCSYASSFHSIAESLTGTRSYSGGKDGSGAGFLSAGRGGGGLMLTFGTSVLRNSETAIQQHPTAMAPRTNTHKDAATSTSADGRETKPTEKTRIGSTHITKTNII